MRERTVRRMRPGLKALKQIRLIQKAPSLLIRRHPFQTFVRHIANKEAGILAQGNS